MKERRKQEVSQVISPELSLLYAERERELQVMTPHSTNHPWSHPNQNLSNHVTQFQWKPLHVEYRERQVAQARSIKWALMLWYLTKTFDPALCSYKINWSLDIFGNRSSLHNMTFWTMNNGTMTISSWARLRSPDGAFCHVQCRYRVYIRWATVLSEKLSFNL